MPRSRPAPPFSPAVRYRTALALAGVRGFFVPAAVGRLGVAMVPLAVLWAVQGATGSFARAGLATGAYAVAEAVVGPQVARLVDVHGQRRSMIITTPVFAAVAAGLVWCCVTGRAPVAAIVVLAAWAGAVCPQVGTLSAARWRQVAGDTDHLPAALSLEAAVNDLSFLIGPVVVTTLSATVHPSLGLVTATVLVLVGVGLVVLSTDTEPPPQPRGAGLLLDRRLLTRRFAPFPVVHLFMGLFFGGIPICLTAFALAHGVGAVAGAFAAASGVVSLASGLAYGALADRIRPLPVMLAASSVLAVGCLGLSTVPTVGLMLVAYAAVGGMVAPVLVPAAVLLQRAVPSAIYTQAITWTGPANAVGIALVAPVVGHVIETTSPSTGFVVIGGLMVLLPLFLVLVRGRLPSTAG